MPTGTFHYQDEAERLSIEAAIAFVAEMRQLALCEEQALGLGRGRGRALLCSALREAV